jgi:hypothetical protein
MLKNVFAAAVLFSAINVNAADFSYSHFDIGLASIEIDDEGDSYNGHAVGLDLSVELGEVFYATAGLATADVEETNQDTKSLGLGVHAPLSESVDVYAEAAYVRVDVSFGDWNFDDTGSAYTLGLRSKVTDRLELGGGVNHLDVFDGTDNSYFVNVFFAAKETVHVGGEISKGEDSIGYGIALRINF